MTTTDSSLGFEVTQRPARCNCRCDRCGVNGMTPGGCYVAVAGGHSQHVCRDCNTPDKHIIRYLEELGMVKQ